MNTRIDIGELEEVIDQAIACKSTEILLHTVKFQLRLIKSLVQEFNAHLDLVEHRGTEILTLLDNFTKSRCSDKPI